jgi:hypothetical protein
MDKKKTFRIPNWENLELLNGHGELYKQYSSERVARGVVGADQSIIGYSHGVSAVAAAYYGGVLSPDGRIYLIPFTQGTVDNWHLIETNGTIKTYFNGLLIRNNNSYAGGVLDPNGRIYLIPFGQSKSKSWEYINTKKIPGEAGHVKNYNAPLGVVANAFIGGTLGYNGNIYLIPTGQATSTLWFYIDSSGTPNSYSHGMGSLPFNAYVGGVLSPDGKIYLIPYTQCTANVWHYIDSTKSPGAAGHVVAYSHGLATKPVSAGYVSGVLSPDGKIYLGPQVQSTDTMWHYIDTNKTPGAAGHVVAYSHGASGIVDNGYQGCSPVTPNGRIYLIPRGQCTTTMWHYIDVTKTPGAAGHVVAYSHGSSGFKTTQAQYIGCALSPNGRLYLVPSQQGDQSIWHYIDTNTNDMFSINLNTSPFHNKL